METSGTVREKHPHEGLSVRPGYRLMEFLEAAVCVGKVHIRTAEKCPLQEIKALFYLITVIPH